MILFTFIPFCLDTSITNENEVSSIAKLNEIENQPPRMNEIKNQPPRMNEIKNQPPIMNEIKNQPPRMNEIENQPPRRKHYSEEDNAIIQEHLKCYIQSKKPIIRNDFQTFLESIPEMKEITQRFGVQSLIIKVRTERKNT